MSDNFGKFGVISDEDLADAIRHNSAEDINVRRMAEELTVRRALDLTAEEVEALTVARECVGVDGDCTFLRDHAKQDLALAVLDRLLRGAK